MRVCRGTGEGEREGGSEQGRKEEAMMIEAGVKIVWEPTRPTDRDRPYISELHGGSFKCKFVGFV